MDYKRQLNEKDYRDLQRKMYTLNAVLWSLHSAEYTYDASDQQLNDMRFWAYCDSCRIVEIIDCMERVDVPDPKPASDDNTASNESEEA